MVKKKYVIYRMPVEADRENRRTQKKLQDRVKAWTGKDVKIPMTRIMVLKSKQPLVLSEDKVIKLVRRKPKR